MNRRGLLPFTSLGLILIILSASLAIYFEWDRHQDVKNSLNRKSVSSLSTRVASGRNDLTRQARESLYKALWRVSKNSDKYGTLENQKKWIEKIASNELKEKLPHLLATQTKIQLYPKLNLDPKRSKIEISSAENGYVNMDVTFSEDASISSILPDNSGSIVLPCDKLHSKSDVRFFLLQNKMKEFEKEFYRINRRWKYAEYALAYIQAWANGEVNLSKSRSKALFQISLSSHEIGKFGSTDYRAIAQDWFDCFADINISDLSTSDLASKSIQEQKIEKLKNRIDSSISKLQRSATELKSITREIKKIRQSKPGERLQEKLNNLTYLKEENRYEEDESFLKKFRKICQGFRTSYSLDQNQAETALEKTTRARDLIKQSWKELSRLSVHMKELAEKNQVMEQLYNDFTKETHPPGVFLQIREGKKNVLEDLDYIKEKIALVNKKFETYKYLDNIFPSNYEKQIKKSLKENMEENTEKILSKALESGKKALKKFERKHEKDKKAIKPILQKISEKVEKQTQKPTTNWQRDYSKYPEPGEKPRKPPEKKTAKKFVIKTGMGTIGGIENILTNVKKQFNRLEQLLEEFEKKRKNLESFDINKKLENYIRKNPKFPSNEKFTREQSYGIFPPKPLFQEPGLSVYHEVEIEKVEYKREDPLGLAYKSAPPTPIYLWFIDTVIYWAMWNVKIRLREPLTEEIFDYKNQTIPRPLVEGSNVYIHKPLAYRKEFQKKDFNFRLLVFSLRNFSVSYD